MRLRRCTCRFCKLCGFLRGEALSPGFAGECRAYSSDTAVDRGNVGYIRPYEGYDLNMDMNMENEIETGCILQGALRVQLLRAGLFDHPLTMI